MVGRSPDSDVRLEDEAVSWNHLEIELRGDVLMATDLDSRNGTALNGEPLDRPRRLRDGDTLIVGEYRLEVKTGSSDAGRRDRRQQRAGRRADRGGAGDRRRARRPLPQRGSLRRPPRDPRRDRRRALHVSERTAQRRLDALAAKLDVSGDAGRDRPRQIAARVIELGLDRPR